MSTVMATHSLIIVTTVFISVYTVLQIIVTTVFISFHCIIVYSSPCHHEEIFVYTWLTNQWPSKMWRRMRKNKMTKSIIELSLELHWAYLPVHSPLHHLTCPLILTVCQYVYNSVVFPCRMDLLRCKVPARRVITKLLNCYYKQELVWNWRQRWGGMLVKILCLWYWTVHIYTIRFPSLCV